MASPSSSPTAKRYAVRLRGDRVLESAFREAYEEILRRNGKQAAGDYMRQCLLSGHALHGKQWRGHDPKASGPEIESIEGVNTDSQTPVRNTQQNDNEVVSDNESGGTESGTKTDPGSDQAEKGDSESADQAGQRQSEGSVRGASNIATHVLRTIAKRHGESGNQNDAG